MSQPWQVLADCPHCRIEAAVVELMDPAHAPCAHGIPQWRRCRACGFEERSEPDGVVVVVRTAADLRPIEAARAALSRWAADEGEVDLEQFCTANLGGTFGDVSASLARGEGVSSTFDVIAFLFPQAGAMSSVAEVGRPVFGAPVGSAPAPSGRVVDIPATALDPARDMDERTPGRFLVSVMLADGALRAGERRFVDTFLARNGLPPVTPADLRVWRPLELGPPPPPELRDLLLEAAVHLMHLDRTRDGSEWRVVQVFASAWGLSTATLRAWDEQYGRRYSTVMFRLGSLLSRWIT